MLIKDVTYEPLQDFTPVAMLGIVPVGLFVPASSPTRNMQDLIAAAKANPGAINFGTPGVGTVTHIAVEMLMDRAGIQMKHVPYGGGPNYWTDLAGGQLQLVSAGISSGLPLVKDGRVRLNATATAARAQATPDVPAVGESFPGYDAPAWIGLAVARGTPDAAITKLEGAAMEVIQDSDTKATLGRAGIEVKPLDRQAFANRIASDVSVWQSTFHKSGLLAK
jgi:tripartite-type tricarboxylate transporter receptor subunit TctC